MHLVPGRIVIFQACIEAMCRCGCHTLQSALDRTCSPNERKDQTCMGSTLHRVPPGFRENVKNTHFHIEALCNQGKLDEALDMALSNRVPTMDIDPNYPYNSLLKAFGKAKLLNHVKLLYNHVALHRDSCLSGPLGNDFVITLAKCGALHSAHQLFQGLSERTVHSWTAIIAGYADLTRAQDALHLYSLMQAEGVEPDEYTYIALFKACGTLANVHMGIELHNRALKAGFTTIIFVSNTLIRMYGKCGSIKEAENVFEHMFQRDTVSWNSILSVYVELGHEEKALQLYRQMIEEMDNCDAITFVSTLQACGALAKKDEDRVLLLIEIGRSLHADAHKQGCTSSVYVASALQSMYGKYGMVLEATNVFQTLSCSHNVVTWNTMLSAYVEHGDGRETLQLYTCMREEGENPNQQTMVIALQACSILADKEEAFVLESQLIKPVALTIGRAMHEDVDRMGDFASDVFVRNALVSMYGRCGNLTEAENVFSGSSMWDVVSWNAMLSAYVDQGHGVKALRLYRQMLEEGMHADGLTFVFALRACGSVAENERAIFVQGEAVCMVALEIGQALHADAWRKGLSSHIFFNNTLVSMYGKCGSLRKAECVLDALKERDVVTWNALLSTYVDHTDGSKALRSCMRMCEEGKTLNQLTLVLLLQACGALAETEQDSLQEAAVKIGQALHDLARHKGFMSEVSIQSTLVSMYGKCGTIEKAKAVFDEMPPCSIVPWNAMLSAYIEQDQGEKALELYKDMQKVKVTMTDITLMCILQACGASGCIKITSDLHFTVVIMGYDAIPAVANTILFAYRGCACMADGLEVFEGLPQQVDVSWNACIAGHAQEGNCAASLQMLVRMHMAGISPDDITTLSILTAYSHAGLIDKGMEYFNLPSLGLKHYTIMMDLFGRAGHMKGMESILQRMPMEPNLSIWLCVLGACRTHGNVDLGSLAFDNAVWLNPTDTAPYVLMSNMYIEAGMQERRAMELQKLGMWGCLTK